MSRRLLTRSAAATLTKPSPDELLAVRMESLGWHDRVCAWAPAGEVRKAHVGGNDDGYTLEGYAAVFDQWTRIVDWVGTYEEQIKRSAFKKTLRERTPVVQLDHGHNALFGDAPIAVHRDATEDDYGLLVVAPLLREHPYIEFTREMIREQAITGMSFRFEVLQETWEYDYDGEGTDRRTITEVRLHEYGPVMFPAYAGTEVGLRAAQALSPEARSMLGFTEAQPSSSTTAGAAPATGGDQHPEADAAGTERIGQRAAVELLAHMMRSGDPKT